MITTFTFADKRSEEFVDKKIAEIQTEPAYTRPGMPDNYKEIVIGMYEAYKKYDFPYCIPKDEKMKHANNKGVWEAYGKEDRTEEFQKFNKEYKKDFETQVSAIDLKWNYVIGFNKKHTLKITMKKILKKLTNNEIVMKKEEGDNIFFYIWLEPEEWFSGYDELFKKYNLTINDIKEISKINFNSITYEKDSVERYKKDGVEVLNDFQLHLFDPIKTIGEGRDIPYKEAKKRLTYLLNKYNILPYSFKMSEGILSFYNFTKMNNSELIRELVKEKNVHFLKMGYFDIDNLLRDFSE